MTKNGWAAKKRHLTKTITWRIVGTLDTMALGWLVSGDPIIGLKVGGLELVTKMILYYFHERAWYTYRPNRKRKYENNKG